MSGTLRTIADRGISVSLDAFMANDPDWTEERYSSSLVSSTNYGGKIQGIGIGFSVPVLFHNANLVKDALGDEAFPDNWDDIIKLTQQIGHSDKKLIGGFYRTDALFFQAQLNSRGSNYMNAAETEVWPDSKVARSAFQFIEKMGEAGQAKVPMKRDEAHQAFAAGTVGILSDMSSGISSRKKQIAGRFELGIAKFPIPAGQGGIPAAGIAVIMSTKDKTRQAAAWKFMKYLADVKGQETVARETSYIPSNNAAIGRSQELKAKLQSEPLLKPVLESVSSTTPWYAFPGSNSAKIDVVIADTAEAVSTLKLSPQDALEKTKAELMELVSQ